MLTLCVVQDGSRQCLSKGGLHCLSFKSTVLNNNKLPWEAIFFPFQIFFFNPCDYLKEKDSALWYYVFNTKGLVIFPSFLPPSPSSLFAFLLSHFLSPFLLLLLLFHLPLLLIKREQISDPELLAGKHPAKC